MAACAPGYHGDNRTSVSDKIDQKTKVGQNTRFFLRIFFPAHFDHWKLRKSLLVVVVVVVVAVVVVMVTVVVMVMVVVVMVMVMMVVMVVVMEVMIRDESDDYKKSIDRTVVHLQLVLVVISRK